jgi:transposase-like protein
MEMAGMAGRKPLGPALVEHLDGSADAKTRLELILKTLAGQVAVVEACRILDISEAMFYKLRNRVLQNCLEDLEPKMPGRPPRSPTQGDEQHAELSAQITTLERQLAVQAVRLELAEVMPHVAKHAAVKKTTVTRENLSKQPKQRSLK